MYKKSNLKIVLSFLLALVLAFNLVTPALAAGEEPAKPRQLTILHTNDMHGRAVEEISKEGKTTNLGYAKYKTFIDQKKAAGPTLVVDAGDNIHGTNFAALSTGQSMIDLMELVGTTAFVPGNHDFNYGAERLLELTSNTKVKTVASNVLNEDGEQVFSNGFVTDVDGIKVGIFGIATPETKYKSNPLNTKGLDFTKEAESADASVKKLKAEGAEVIVFLSHLGIDDSSDVTTFTVLDAMKHAADVDVVIDGHSHSLLKEGKPYAGTHIASARQYFEYVGEATITLELDGSKHAESKLHTAESLSGLAEDPTVLAKVKEVQEVNKEVEGKVIGYTAQKLDGERADVRTKETNLGNILTDAMLKETGADIALTNGGGMRASIEAGQVTLGEVLTVLPFGNLATVIEVTGQDVVDALTHGAGDYPKAKGAFPHVAGMEYTIVTVNDKFSHIENVLVDGKPIDLEKTYELVTNDFMAIGGDDYTMFEGSKQVSLHGLLADFLANAFEGSSEENPLVAKAEGRVKVDAREAARSLTILHTNDMHGRAVEEISKEGKTTNLGYAKYKTFIDQKKAAGPTLVVDAGDNIHGTNFAALSTGQSMIDLMELVGTTAFVPGNHDFNYGAERLLELTSNTNVQTVASNVIKDGKKVFNDGFVTDVDGIKVGIFGIATPETKYKSNPLNTKGLDFTKEAESADASVKKLKAEGAEVIVFLSHLGIDDSSDVTTFTVLDAMKLAADVDVVIDGHSHSLLKEGKPYAGTHIASARQYFEYVGEATITLELDGSKHAESKLHTAESLSGLAEDPTVLAKVKEVQEANAEVEGKVIGYTAQKLDGERADVRTKETNLGNILTDAMIEETGAEIALTNGGGIRASIDAGQVTLGEVLTVLPFGNLATVIEVTGQDVVDALTHGAGDYPNAKGAFPHVSGMEYTIVTIDGEFSHIDNVLVGGEPIDLDATYELVTNDFMAIGGDGYTMFEGSKQVSLHGLLADFLANAFEGSSEENPLVATVEGRVKVDVRESSFEDVPKTHWAYQMIEDLNARGMMIGYPDGSFRPSRELTRAEAAKLFVEALELESVEEAKRDFFDVKDNHWAKVYIDAASEANIIVGFKDGSYKPDKAVTRAEFAIMANRAYKLGRGDVKVNLTDLEQAWYYEPVMSLASHGIINGYKDNTFRPENNINRAEAAKIISLLLDR